ncbi:LTA synthase family protein [Chitinilyticum piscinae]|uniref:LTA synthase family protein n=1 Tax=Chitinilyticum piscinae TaxID=2866724 RepID=A0A8J7FP57_9NEIS|nr:LTA synthase family protein [Chitinilyticum piscinae]MBE9607941.1 LTA synthase family protein [Chitinilyticum piscinae]
MTELRQQLLCRWQTVPLRWRRLLLLWGPVLALLLGRILLEADAISPARLVFVLLLYWLLAFPLARWAAVTASLAIEYLLLSVNQIKEAQTGSPLLARDLLEVAQGVALSSYIIPGMYVALVILLLSLIVGWYYRTPRSRRRWLLASVPASALPMLLVLQLPLHDSGSWYVRQGLRLLGVQYHEYNHLVNARTNGMLAHLFQTAEVVRPPRAAPHDFYQRQVEYALPAERPDVVMILCEGCFTSFDDRFPTAMQQLGQRGFSPFYLISPVYGGGTAEAEFEVLTGLSSAVLPGIDYQSYAQDFRRDARTLVSRFRDAGYQTSGLHNFYANFWRRQELYPAFGFTATRFVEDMPWRTRGWPQDALLYDAALEAYRKSPRKQPNFMFLITVRTHGAFTHEGDDFGRKDYDLRLGEAMKDMTAFFSALEKEAHKRKRPLAIVVFGDHKPTLTGAFERAGVLPASLFLSRGAHNDSYRFIPNMNKAQWQARAQSSAYVRLSDPQAGKALAERLNDRPMFCLPAELAGLVPGQDDAFWRAVLARCRQPVDTLLEHEPVRWRQTFPLGLYGERLF